VSNETNGNGKHKYNDSNNNISPDIKLQASVAVKKRKSRKSSE